MQVEVDLPPLPMEVPSSFIAGPPGCSPFYFAFPGREGFLVQKPSPESSSLEFRAFSGRHSDLSVVPLRASAAGEGFLQLNLAFLSTGIPRLRLQGSLFDLLNCNSSLLRRQNVLHLSLSPGMWKSLPFPLSVLSAFPLS